MTWEEYKKLLPKYSDEDLKFIEGGFEFAEFAHQGQKRATGEDYIVHPIEVSLNVAKIGLDPKAVAASLLHDTVEDSSVELKTIRKKFGEEVAFLVNALTKVSAIRLQSDEKTVESARKMFLAMSQDIRVVIIKLLDRLHNMETLEALPAQDQKRISLETLEIYSPIADRLGMGEIKAKLEDRAFQYAFPEEFSWIKKEVRERMPRREKYLEKVIPIVKKELEKEGIKILDIHWRDKHLYSLWKKLQRYEMDWNLIFDLVAVRIMVKSIEDCYATLGVLHKLWRPLPGRIKDYIALAKQNGYRSLHTTVFCVDKIITEFQIRTAEMHNEAEAGIASHWAWEMAGKPAQGPKLQASKFNWIKQLREWHKAFDKDAASDKSFLDALKIDFFKDRVFVLTPRGDVVDLPESATPIDFAYQIHSEIGDHMSGAKVNGRIVPFNHQLASGDIVEIIVQKNKKPSSEWLSSAKTSLAKGHIRSYLNKYGYLIGIKPKQKLENKTEIVVTAKDRIGLLKDISNVFYSNDINIQELATKENIDYPKISVIFTPKNKEQLQKIKMKIKTIKGVEQVESHSLIGRGGER
jgi:guanosine-3',5'-bis(diphosphate) 3'-pyrophosphohydrolase